MQTWLVSNYDMQLSLELSTPDAVVASTEGWELVNDRALFITEIKFVSARPEVERISVHCCRRRRQNRTRRSARQQQRLEHLSSSFGASSTRNHLVGNMTEGVETVSSCTATFLLAEWTPRTERDFTLPYFSRKESAVQCFDEFRRDTVSLLFETVVSKREKDKAVAGGARLRRGYKSSNSDANRLQISFTPHPPPRYARLIHLEIDNFAISQGENSRVDGTFRSLQTPLRGIHRGSSTQSGNSTSLYNSALHVWVVKQQVSSGGDRWVSSSLVCLVRILKLTTSRRI